jgi:hypothetical protein
LMFLESFFDVINPTYSIGQFTKSASLQKNIAHQPFELQC